MELRRLLLDFDWLQAKLEALGPTGLITDYDFVPDDTDLRLVQGAIRLAAHILSQDKSQLGSQLLGRLLEVNSPQIQKLLEKARHRKSAPWLRPVRASLTPPGGPLLRTLRGHTGAVHAVAVTPDGQRAVSGSWDHTLKVWDLERGEELRTLRGHSGTHMALICAGSPTHSSWCSSANKRSNQRACPVASIPTRAWTPLRCRSR